MVVRADKAHHCDANHFALDICYQGHELEEAPAPLGDQATNAMVSWGPQNNSFVVCNPLEFARDLHPEYFKHNKLLQLRPPARYLCIF